MTEFEYQNGTAEIGEKQILLDSSPMKGIRQIYSQRKGTFFLLIASILLFYYIAIFYGGVYYRLLAIFLALFVGLNIIAVVLEHFGLVNSTVVIPRESVERAEYRSNNSIKLSRLYIVYCEDGKEQNRSVWLSFPALGGSDRLEKAIQTIESSGIPVVEK